MGRREFFAWCDACWRAQQGPEIKPDSWDGYEQDEWYQQARQKRTEQFGG